MYPNYQVLVNKNHPIPADFISKLELADIEAADGNTYQVEKTAKQAYEALHDALIEQGIEIGVDSAYRSVERQKKIMAEFTALYGEEYAKATVAEPGTSEHHTGLALDIVPKAGGKWVTENEEMLALTDIFSAIHALAPKFGFIVRYPKGQEEVTGYSYEPWHLRYVGVDAAGEIAARGLTLEEYSNTR